MATAYYAPLATPSLPQSPSTPTQPSPLSEGQMDAGLYTDINFERDFGQWFNSPDILRSGEDSRLRRHRPQRRASEVVPPPAVLFCGEDQGPDAGWDEHRPWTVETLPETEMPPPPRKRQRRSNGCGARIHTRAEPDKRWLGSLDDVRGDVVVALEEEYFQPDMRRELLLGKERCGCCKSGVGCAICGNPLGALFTPCPRHALTPSHTAGFAAAHYIFLRSAVSPPLPTRRVQATSEDIRNEREIIQRRIREREEYQQYQQMRTRARAAQMQGRSQTQTRAADVAADDHRVQLPRFLMRRERESDPYAYRAREEPHPYNPYRAREELPAAVPPEQPSVLHPAASRVPHEPPPPVLAPTVDRAFEAWADETIQRATAVAASDVPVVVDLSALMDLPASEPRPGPGSQPQHRTDRDSDSPRFGTSEWWRNMQLQGGIVSATRQPSVQEWTAMTLRSMAALSGNADQARESQTSTTRETEEQEQDKEEAAPRTFFER
ncbi:hypothetical protein GGX14DRAFT_694763 [Mycena pura]|uniref:Uncharacterized protein n=1 Tax=Mycena pura TaxID=153505 RepID=A0AAD6VXB9_9AGAR|nr:hypothetical protein GGX14DRAFT_694763 [Mycena pura]